MAQFQDLAFDPNQPVPGQPQANLGQQISNLLSAAMPYSVEVIRVADDRPLVLRVWRTAHCNSANHQPIGPKLGP